MTVVVGTAGHIDHGKTTLLAALTGIDADRLPEERRRGLTIDIGYAHGAPDAGPPLDFVDVPGHDRLIGNMLVGVGEIDAALLVVAADDGPRAQTWEHLGLLDAMAIDRGIVAITKIDAVDEAGVRRVRDDVATLLDRTCLGGSPVVAVSAVSGQGLAALRHQLAMLRDAVLARRRPRHRGAWLAIDRVFSMHGHGVVVTGSARGGAITAGDTLMVRPGARRARVRAVQVHDEVVEAATDDGRVALNLAGLTLADLHRGQLLASLRPSDDVLDPFDSDGLLVALYPPASLPGRLPDDPWPPRDGTEVRLHIGTHQVEARLGRSGRLAVGGDAGPAFAVIRATRPVATAIGERFVLRRPQPAGLLAGGLVLDAGLPRGRARSRLVQPRLVRLHDAVVANLPDGVEDALVDLHGLRGTRLAPDVQRAASQGLMAAVSAHRAQHPVEAGLPLSTARSTVVGVIRRFASTDPESSSRVANATIASAIEAGRLEQVGDAIHAKGYQPAAPDRSLAQAGSALVAVLDVAAPPPLAEAMTEVDCSAATLRQLERAGHVIVVTDDLAWSVDAFGRLRDLALELADEAPVTPAVLRDASGTSRKYIMALLEELDRRGILKRTPQGHVRGPRA